MYNSSAVVDMLPECLYKRIYQRPPHNCENNISPTFDTLKEGDHLKLSSSWYGKTKMAGQQSPEGRIMTDSVIWAQYINETDTQIATQTAAQAALSP